ncbi:MAG TPA: type II secretion system protein [Epsilonproteobacteria bacterium]|nr:type II secretion system protein [Campylobacterota bacterium]
MIELVFVIVVLGILAAISIPRLQSDSLEQAAAQILSDIRYTQHLALTDNTINPQRQDWQRAFWSIRFRRCANNSGWFYVIGADKNNYGGNIDIQGEAAIEPLSGRPMFWNNTDCSTGGDGTVSENIFITRKFGINRVTFTGSCAGVQHIGFDSMGRLHRSFTQSATPNFATTQATPCNINFFHPNGDFTIRINPETGYAFRVGRENL